MWNDPDLDAHRHQSTPDRRERRRWDRNQKDRSKDRGKEEEQQQQPQHQLNAFGYEAFLFHNHGVAEAVEQGQLLITWQGQDPSDEHALWLDRYDVRNLLDDERLFRGPRDILHDNFLQESSDVDEERFEDLDSDEEFLFDMDWDEREEHLAQKRREQETSNYKGIHYEYDKDNNAEQAPESTFQLHFEVPEGMAVPESEKTLALIERTAKFVNNSSEPTMEIILQAKQATNPHFAFMSRRHHLFQFYKHVRWLMQTGLYETAEDVRLREAEEAKAEQEEEERRAAEVAKALEASFHIDIEKVLEKTVEFLVAHEGTSVYEEKLLSMDDIRFAFMNPGHAWHDYYLQTRQEAQEARARARIKEVEAKTLDETTVDIDTGSGIAMDVDVDDSISGILSHRGDSGVASITEAECRAAEMQRLDRLQRVKELLKLKKGQRGADACKISQSGLEGESDDEDSKHRARSKLRSRSTSRSRSRSSNSSLSRSSSRSRSTSRSISPRPRARKRARA
ncbi:hypothetical protein EDD11_008898 [Mortierella claussenii]|nr:hypothetical protein EDD11_008898 [Mortierella claussenii]